MKFNANFKYILLVIILVILILGIKTKYLEGFTDTNIRSGGYDRPMDLYQLNAPYNYTQGEYVKLLNVLKEMPTKGCGKNAIKTELKNPSDYYTLKPETMGTDFKVQLDKVSNVVVARFNKLFGEKGYKSNWKLVDYDNVKVAHDEQGNMHFIYDMFVQQYQDITRNNHGNHKPMGMLPYSVRLRVDLIKPRYPSDCETQEQNENWRMIKYLLNLQGKRRLASYSLGGDYSEEQSLFFPSPLQSLSTPHYPVLDTVNWKKPPEVHVSERQLADEIIINRVHVYNSNLIIYPDAPTRKIPGGVNDNHLEYSCYMNARNYKAEPNVIANKWIPLADEPKCLKSYPCRKVSQCWDKLGVDRPIEPQTEYCNGVRHSTTLPPVYPEFNPTIHTNPRNEGLYSWLFDLYRQEGEGRNFAY